MAEENQEPQGNEELEALKAKVGEFRDSNVALKESLEKEQAAREAQQAEIDALKARVTEGDKAQTEKQTLAERLEALERANAAKDEALRAEQAKGRESAKREALTAEFLRRNGNNATAAKDAAALAMADWDLGEDGTLKPTGTEFDAEGNKITPAKYAEAFLLERPHFAGKSSGDGRQAGDGFDGQGRRVVDGNDPVALGEYAEEIAAGNAVLAPTE